MASGHSKLQSWLFCQSQSPSTWHTPIVSGPHDFFSIEYTKICGTAQYVVSRATHDHVLPKIARSYPSHTYPWLAVAAKPREFLARDLRIAFLSHVWPCVCLGAFRILSTGQSAFQAWITKPLNALLQSNTAAFVKHTLRPKCSSAKSQSAFAGSNKNIFRKRSHVGWVWCSQWSRCMRSERSPGRVWS